MAVLVSRPRRPVVVMDEIHPTTLARYREAIAVAAASLDPVVAAVARQRACQAALERLEVLSVIPRTQLQNRDYQMLVAAQITDAVLGVHRCQLAIGPVESSRRQ